MSRDTHRPGGGPAPRPLLRTGEANDRDPVQQAVFPRMGAV